MVIAALALTTLKLRFDIGELPLWLSWGCSLVEFAVGIVLVGLALRESVPGNTLPPRTVGLAVVTGLVLQILVGVATWMRTPGAPYDTHAIGMGLGCLSHDCFMAVPTFAVTLWLVFRALPMRAPVAGLLGGAGAAIIADAITHLQCPMSDLRHVLVWHTGAIFLFMALGWGVGKAWEMRGEREIRY
jgi:hypothetical protein